MNNMFLTMFFFSEAEWIISLNCFPENERGIFYYLKLLLEKYILSCEICI